MKKRILIFVDNNFEDMELYYPKYRMLEAGATVVVAGNKANEVYKSKHGYPCKSDLAFSKVNVKDYDALIIPGGYAPDTLRVVPEVLDITRKFFKDKKLIAFICHAGWIPVSAGIVKGVKCTSYATIKDDLVNAGAKWVDKAVVNDCNLISSRSPDDLPVFCQAILKHLGG